MFLLWLFPTVTRNPVSSRFNPLYWGVLIVTGLTQSEIAASLVSILFIEVFLLWLRKRRTACRSTEAVSILFIEVFLLWLKGGLRVDEKYIPFQSSLLRCSYCDPLPIQDRPQSVYVSILFIEVFLLWQRTLNPLICLDFYAVLRTPPPNNHNLGDFSLV